MLATAEAFSYGWLGDFLMVAGAASLYWLLDRDAKQKAQRVAEATQFESILEDLKRSA